MTNDTVSFSVAEVGETTGKSYNWSFTAKRWLSQRDRISKDSLRRSLLGDRPGEASPDAIVRVELLSHLQVSLVESPKDWRELGNGLDLIDDNILIAVHEKVLEGQNKAVEETVKQGEEAKEKLRKRKGQKDEGFAGGA